MRAFSVPSSQCDYRDVVGAGRSLGVMVYLRAVEERGQSCRRVELVEQVYKSGAGREEERARLFILGV